MSRYIMMFLCLSAAVFSLETEETPWTDPKDLVKYPGLVTDALIVSYYEEEKPPEPVKSAGDEESLEDSVEAPSTIKETPPYRIHVGDMFTISVYGEAGSQRTVRVDPTGSISYLFINDLPVLGKTIDEMRALLNEKLVYFYKFPLVVIIPRELFGNSYTILGEVMSPGVRKIVGHTTLLTALCDAGGFQTRLFRQQTIDRVDLDHSFLARKGEYFPVDFRKLIEDGDMSQDVELEDGDYIYLPMYYTDQVFVLGEVAVQRGINYVNPMTVLKAIAMSGGVTLRASSRVAILRGSLTCPVRYLVDYNRIAKGYTCDFQLMPGDIVYVPPRHFQSLRDLWKWAVQSWVLQAASTAGTNTYLNVNPRALTTGVVSPQPVIGGGVVAPAATPAGP